MKPESFGDLAQLRVAVGLRRRTYEERRRSDPISALQFPEFRERHNRQSWVQNFIGRMVPNFDRLYRDLPGFADIVKANPYEKTGTNHGGRTRKSRHKARQLWKRTMLTHYLQQFEDQNEGLMTIYTAINWVPEWWLKAELQLAARPMELPLAA